MKGFFLCSLVLVACSSATLGPPEIPLADAAREAAGGGVTDPAVDATFDSGGQSVDGSGDSGALPEDAGGMGGDGSSPGCSTERATLLGAVDTVATTDVALLATADSISKIYVDASAGGPAGQATNPWIFVDLASGSKVPVTDTGSMTSKAWDLALKRSLLYTNDGDGGPGAGGAVLISKKFDAVTASDAVGAALSTESFFDAACTPKLDPSGAVRTTLAAWYSYDSNTHVLTPADGTWLVRGGTGKLYKVQIETYYGTSDGGTGMAGGRYVLDVGVL